nr:uncharacterized protein LOC113692085 isoform X2 [Coffea arabica]
MVLFCSKYEVPYFLNLCGLTCQMIRGDSGAFVFIHQNWDKLNFISFHQENASSVGTTFSNLSNFISFQDGQFQGFHYCNGLLALVFQSKDDGHKDFLVCNPTSSQQRHIPRINLLERERRFAALNIVFHPVESDDYKLVCVWSERYMPRNDASQTPLRRYEFSIYSSETGTWRDAKAINGRDFVYIYFMNGMLCNGDLHWVSGRRETLCFDLDKECLNLTVPSPRMHHSESDIWDFGVS